jgi:predicted metal-dependent hydrolase
VSSDISDFDAPVSVRISNRAKRVSFNVSRLGLEVVVPRRFNRSHLPDLIAGQRVWIDSALDRARAQWGGFAGVSTPSLPITLELRALNDTVALRYSERTIAKPLIMISDGIVDIDYPTDKQRAVFDLLRKYLKQRAGHFFNQRLTSLSESSGLPYSRICVRGQRSRWGSYSAKGVVNLNFKLLFLPPELVDHVLLHELCHAKYMNHSARFWSLLTSLDPATAAHRKALRYGDRFIPDWVEFHPLRNPDFLVSPPSSAAPCHDG